MPVPLIRLVAGTSETIGLPFPVATDQLRQLKLDNIGPIGLVESTFGFAPRPMEGRPGVPQAEEARPDGPGPRVRHARARG